MTSGGDVRGSGGANAGDRGSGKAVSGAEGWLGVRRCRLRRKLLGRRRRE